MTILILLISLLLLPLELFALPTHDNTVTFGGEITDQINTSIDVGALCANPIIVVDVGFTNTSFSVTSINVGGSAAASVGSATNTDVNRRISMWQKTGVSTGSVAVAITFNDFAAPLGTIRSYCDVDQTTPMGTPVTAFDVTGTPTVNVTSASTELVIDAATSGSAGLFTSVGSGQTQRANQNIEFDFSVAGSDETGANPTTMSWGLSEADYWAIIAVALKPAPAAATSVLRQQTIVVQ